MKVIYAFLLTGVLAAACAGQPATARQTAPEGVVVVSFEWHSRHTARRQENNDPNRAGDYALNDPANPRLRRDMRRGTPVKDPQRLSLPSVQTPRPVFSGYESSVHLKNTGAKTIKAVEWEHVFYKDKEKREELQRFKFRKGAKVGPGAQKFVAGRVATKDYSQLPSRARQSVEIKRIEYADGSVWQSW